MARRLSERGVRFVQLYYGNGQPWDTHGDNDKRHRQLCGDIDQPVAALLGDLKRRGLLDETLVTWGGEFGRTPTTQGKNGATTTSLDSRGGWPAVAFEAARSTEQRTTSAFVRFAIRFMCMTCTPRSFTC